MKTIANKDFYPELINYLTQKGCNLFLVQAEYQRPGTSDRPADLMGLDVALSLDDDAPILLCSFFLEWYFIKEEKFSTKFFALMAKKRTGFIDAISEPQDFYYKYLELINSEKEEDALALEINRIREYQNVMGAIQHIIFGRFDYKDPRATEYINKARDIGVEGTDEQVFQTILDFKRDASNPKFAGKYFPGIFCDIEGTLFINDEVNLKLVEKLRELSLAKPITLWTGGDVKEYQKKLISKNITWKLVSKNDFFGTEIEIAYDDLSYEKFQLQYGIKVRQFHQVTHNHHDEDLELRLEFLHSLLVSSGVPEVLIHPKFSFILDMFIESKQVREYVKEMEHEEDENQYNQRLIIVRDFLVGK